MNKPNIIIENKKQKNNKEVRRDLNYKMKKTNMFINLKINKK
jgi:hypothetical protein